jgi:hypothetical protein
MKAQFALCLSVLLYGTLPGSAETFTAHRIAITLDSQAPTNEILVAEALKQRLSQVSDLSIEIGDGPADLRIFLGDRSRSATVQPTCVSSWAKPARPVS